MNPILFEVPWFSGPVPYHAYGFFLAMAFLMGMSLTVREGRKQGVQPDHVVALCFIAIVTSLAGSRLMHLVMVERAAFFRDPAIFFQFSRGGYAFYGGFLAAIATAIVYCRVKGYSILMICDLFTPGLAFGLAFGRTGCLLAGCCHGRPIAEPLPDWAAAILPWSWPEVFSLTFPSDAGGLGGLLDQPLVPTQPLSGLYCLAIFLLLALWIVPNKRYHGQVFVWYCILYAIARSTVELFRGDDRGMYLGETVSTSQLVSVPVILVGVGILLWARSRLSAGTTEPLPAGWRDRAVSAAGGKASQASRKPRKKQR
jgi:phosphatidylglycerol---prolipoprotein diacylglyceryl transferase